MIDEMSKFYNRKEVVSAAGVTEPEESSLDAASLLETPSDSVRLGHIFDPPANDLYVRRRNRIRSSSIL